MRIKYLAHASFLIISQANKRIITDPYYTGKGLNYRDINESADIVTISHGHSDHNNIGAIKGNPIIVKEAASKNVKDIYVKGIPAFHDEAGGSKRGNNLIFCFTVDGIDICHLGDLGHSLTERQLADIGHVDILMIPVGGFFTIDAEEAAAVARSIGAKAIFPMHYKTAKADYSIKSVDEFLQNKNNIRRIKSSEIEITRDTLPSEMQIFVLQPALL